MMDPMDEARIIKRCRAGDLGVYRQIYDRYGPPLLRTATRILGRPHEAEAAVQETFLKLFRGIGAFRSGARFSTYHFQILHNTCMDMLLKRKPAVAARIHGWLTVEGKSSAVTVRDAGRVRLLSPWRRSGPGRDRCR